MRVVTSSVTPGRRVWAAQLRGDARCATLGVIAHTLGVFIGLGWPDGAEFTTANAAALWAFAHDYASACEPQQAQPQERSNASDADATAAARS